MSARNFGSLVMVASCAGAALSCYLVSLRVASERAAVESVESQIVVDQRDLRLLQTEIGTRGRLAQLERWNVKVLALSAPSADQFLRGGFELARLTQPQHQVDFEAPVVLASAPAPKRPAAPIGEPAITDDSAAPPGATGKALLHQASLKTETREVPAKPAATMPLQAGKKSMEQPVTAAKPAQVRSLGKPGLAAAKPAPAEPSAKAGLAAAKPARSPQAKKSVDKLAHAVPAPVTKPVRIARTDPLAPLAVKHAARSTTKD